MIMIYGVDDILRSILSILSVVPQLFPQALPYTLDFILFAGFVYWNGGIVLGESCTKIIALLLNYWPSR